MSILGLGRQERIRAAIARLPLTGSSDNDAAVYLRQHFREAWPRLAATLSAAADDATAAGGPARIAQLERAAAVLSFCLPFVDEPGVGGGVRESAMALVTSDVAAASYAAADVLAALGPALLPDLLGRLSQGDARVREALRVVGRRYPGDLVLICRATATRDEVASGLAALALVGGEALGFQAWEWAGQAARWVCAIMGERPELRREALQAALAIGPTSICVEPAGALLTAHPAEACAVLCAVRPDGVRVLGRLLPDLDHAVAREALAALAAIGSAGHAAAPGVAAALLQDEALLEPGLATLAAIGPSPECLEAVEDAWPAHPEVAGPLLRRLGPPGLAFLGARTLPGLAAHAAHLSDEEMLDLLPLLVAAGQEASAFIPRVAAMLQGEPLCAKAAMKTLSSLGAAARVVAPQILACFTEEPSAALAVPLAQIADPSFFDPLITHLFHEPPADCTELAEAMTAFSASTAMSEELIRQAVRAAGRERAPGRFVSDEALSYLIASEEPAAVNILHLVAAKQDVRAGVHARHAGPAVELSFATQRQLARQALADRGDPDYDPAAYLLPSAGRCPEAAWPATSPAAAEDAAAGAAGLRRALSCFVSSTYSDMAAEREALATVVFPQIRTLCEQRGVRWDDIDLRHGLALSEAAAESRLLAISLPEIQRVRPFFIGLLGERYGWVPPELPAELAAAQPWLVRAQGRSLTELEFMAGALDAPWAEVRPRVYLRHPSYLETLPPGTRGAFLESSAEGSVALMALKERLRASDRVVIREYADPREFTELVLDDLRELVDRLYPQGSSPALLSREAAEHEAFARRRAAAWVGRPECFARLDEHADAGTGMLAVLGEAGVGKSALLAAWSLRRRETHPQRLLVTHFVGASPSSVSPLGMLRRLMAELAHRLALRIEAPESPDDLPAAFGALLNEVASRGGAVIVIDGLDELDDDDGARELGWLPTEVPSGIRFIVSGLPTATQRALRRRECPEVTVRPLTTRERAELVSFCLARDGRQLPAAVVARLVSAPQCASPLYLRLLLDELGAWGGHARLDEVLEHYLAAYDATDLFGLALGRCEADVDAESPGLVRRAVAGLWAARAGLSELELLDALGRRRSPLPRALWTPLRLALGASLEERDGVLTFAHALLADVAGRRYAPTAESRRAAHLALADCFGRGGRRCSRRGVAELPWQLAQAGEWRRLFRLLADKSFLAAAWETDCAEVRSLWSDLLRQGYTVGQAYSPLLGALGHVPGGALWPVATLLLEAGHLQPALLVHGELIRRAREDGDNEGRAAALANQAVILERAGDLSAALDMHRERERLLRELGDREALAACLREQASVLERQGRLDDTVAALVEHEAICRALSDWEGLAACLDHQAAVLTGMGATDTAERLYREQEALCRELGQAEGLQRALMGQAGLRRQAGDSAAARARLREAEKACRRLGHARGLLQALERHVELLRDGVDDDEALVLLREEEQLCRALGEGASLQRCLGRQAGILRCRGERYVALGLLKEREQLCRDGGDAESLRQALAARALLCEELGDHQTALALHAEEERLCRELGTAWGLATSLWNQALLYEKLGNDAAVARLCAQRAELSRELGDESLLARTLDKQAAALAALGDAGAALRVGVELERLLRTLGDVEGLERCLDREAGILLAQGQYDTAESLYREQEQLCRRLGTTRELLVSLGNQALVRRLLGDYEEALALHREQERGCRSELADRGFLAVALLEQAETWIVAGEPEEGLLRAREAERLFRALGDLPGVRDALQCAGASLDAAGEWDEALVVAGARRHACLELGDRGGATLALADAALLLTKLGRAAEGLDVAREAQQAADDGADEVRQQVRAVLAWLTTAEALRASIPEIGAVCPADQPEASTSL